MADAKLTALSETSVPDVADLLYSVDVSDTTDDAAGSSRKLTFKRLGGMLMPGTVNGRLTLATGTPVTTSDQTSKSTIYFTPFGGNTVAVYDGTRWILYSFSELSLSLGTITSGANYDVFLYDSSGLTLKLGPAWSSDTARGTGAGTTEITTQDGVYVNANSITSGPGPKAGLYLGTLRTTSTTTTEDSLAKRFVWNNYNRMKRPMKNADEPANSWTYGSATWRQANANSLNKVEYVVGQQYNAIRARVISTIYSYGNIAANAVGVDSTTSPSGHWQETAGSSVEHGLANPEYNGFPGLGYHALNWIEARIAGSGSYSGYGDDGGNIQSGIQAEVIG